MNIFTFLAAFFAIASAILFFRLLSTRDANRQLRAINIELVTAGTELIANFDALEVRNEYLESQATRNRDLTAAAVMFMPRYMTLRGNQWALEVAEMREMP